MKKAAFFDLDMTLISIATEKAFVKHLYKSGMLNKLQVLRVLFTYLRYDISTINNYDDVKRKVIHCVLKNKSEKDFVKSFNSLFESHLISRIYPEVPKLVSSLKSKNYDIYIISAALDFIVQRVSSFLEIDHSYSTNLEIENGLFTGQVKGEIFYGASKGNIIKNIARQEKIDLTQSYAYGDYYEDRYMLELVGNPVAINPDVRLHKYAMEKGWQIMKWKIT